MSPAPILRKLLLLTAVLCLTPAVYADSSDSANAALAEQFHLFAQYELDTVPLADHHLMRAAALLETAVDLDPMQPRHPRLLATVEMLLGNRADALAALNAYGKLRPDDEVARIQYVDLATAGLQTAQDKENFLQTKILDNAKLSAALRSHAAVMLHDLHLERGQQAKADAALKRALELNDVSPAARQRSYEAILRTGDAVQRIEGLAQLLRSNVAQPAVMTALGAELARVNMLDEALDWYDRGTQLALDLQLRAVGSDYMEYGALLLINSQPQEAREIGQQLMQDEASSQTGAQIFLLAGKQSGADIGPAIDEANAAFPQTIADLAGEMEVEVGDDPLDSFIAVHDALAKAGDGREVWLEIQLEALLRYALLTREQPANPKLLDIMTEMLGEQNPYVAAYTGLQLLREGKLDAARVKLEAVKDQNLFAATGLVLLDAKQDKSRDQLRQAASEVLNRQPYGLTGAYVFDQLRQFNVRVQTPENLPAIRDALAKFPNRMLDLLDPARQREFYDVRMKPLRIAHEYGSPMYVRVTIANTGELPLTLGPGGVLRDELQFDASVGNLGALKAVAVGQIGGQVRLDRNEETTRDYRVDLGQLNLALANDPSRPITIFVSGISNPISLMGDHIGPGPGGFRTQMRQPLERQAKALGNDTVRNQLFRQLVNGTGGEKIRAIQTLGRYTQLFQNANDAVAESGQGEEISPEVIAGIVQRIRRARDVEVDPAVRAWAAFELVQIASGEDQAEQVQAMVNDTNPEIRIAGMLVARLLEPATQIEIGESLADDADEQVAEFAKALRAAAVEAQAAANDPEAQATPNQ